MHEPDSTVSLYGTAEGPQALRRIQIGPLNFLYSAESLRRITWHGTELVRAIAWPIRDENWRTYAPVVIEESLEADDDSFTGHVTFAVDEGRLTCDLRLEASSRGEIRAEITMTPVGAAFATNRAGLTVLHPITGVAGAPLSVTHSDGTSEDSEFPRLISPDQPVMDIRGLHYRVGPASVDIAFEGEVFEMEDQRNWSDASYKTYCVPLVHPFTYHIDRPVTQSIRIICGGSGAAAGSAKTGPLTTTVTDQAAPGVGLAIENGWAGGASTRGLIAVCGASLLLIRVLPGDDAAYLADCAALTRLLGAEVDAEIVLPDGCAVGDGLKSAARALANSGLTPARVMALSEGYLASHQPNGPWPDGPSPADLCQSARMAFPNAAIGGGMMTNFTELNRCRPDPAICDYVTHGNTAIVHAGDDLSVIETLETLPQVFDSARALAGGKPYRLGLVSIGMRSNPYGADVTANLQQVRRTMARADPRQRGLFAAAWAVGVLAATANSTVESLCLAAPTGPFGIVFAPQDYPQAGYDIGQPAVYPLFHVFREACRMAGAARLSFDNLAKNVAAYGVRNDGKCHLMIANVSARPQQVTLTQAASVAVMDAGTFGAAVSAADWLAKVERPTLSSLELAPYAVGFATWRD